MGDLLIDHPGQSLETPRLPVSVTRSQLIEAMSVLLGFRPTHVRHLEVGQGAVTVAMRLLDEKGQTVVAGDEVATVTYRLPIINDPLPEEAS